MVTRPAVRGRTGSLARVRVLVSSSTAPSMPLARRLRQHGSVTVLAAEADSFSGDMRLTRAQPGPGCDVACPVEVGVLRAAAGADDGVLPWPGAARAAGVAVAAGVAGVHADHSPSGALSLGDEDAGELSPAGVQDGPVEPGLLGDIPSGFLDG